MMKCIFAPVNLVPQVPLGTAISKDATHPRIYFQATLGKKKQNIILNKQAEKGWNVNHFPA